MRMDEEFWKVFKMAPDAKTMAFGAATAFYSSIVGDEKLKDIENSMFAGNGRIVVSDKGLTAESRLCRVVASTDTD